jgi:two-component system cell cycle sensor histidine kinase/response regulator CckA
MATQPGPASPTVLIIDDEPSILHVMEVWLKSAGFTVVTANAAGQARAFTDKVIPDLIISDVMMPELEGPALVTELKAAGVACPVLFTSGDPSFRVVDDSLQVPGATFLPKPFSSRELIDAVYETLGQR